MTSIEWVKNADGSQGLTWNPIRGCTRVSPGCGGPGPHGGCYAEGIAARFSGPGQPYEGLATMKGGKPRWTGKLAFVESALLLPLRRKKPTTWFVNSMSDLFHESVPDAWIDRVFAIMALCPQHTFQVLTKRSARMRAYLTRPAGDGKQDVRNHLAFVAVADALRHADIKWQHEEIDGPWRSRAIQAGTIWPLPNVWLGVSAEDQRRADERVPDLLATPAAVRFVSAEPLLGPIDFTRIEARSTGTLIGGDFAHPKRIDALTGWAGHYSSPTMFHPRSHRVAALSWIIVGGESGPNARPMHPAWARSIRDQCAAAGVAFHFKQHGAWADVGPHPRGEYVASDPRAEDPIHDRDPLFMAPVGKKAAGRLLDGIEHNGMPEVRI